MPPAPPWRHIGWIRYLTWRVVAWLLPVLTWPAWGLRATGTDTLPKRGPYLLLPNHTSAADPVWVGMRLGRPAHFMASSFLFRFRFLGPLVRFFGAFPKEKFVKDRASMATVQRLIEQGEVVVIFPEGRRTWDGRLTVVGDGIGRLVSRLGVPVVLAHITTGHLQRPRWAERGRKVPVRVHYLPPMTWPTDTPAAHIAQQIRTSLQVDPKPALPKGSRGSGLARGLPVFLWGCPRCGALDALSVPTADPDLVRCGACPGAWRLDLVAQLHPLDGGPPMTVAQAFDTMVAMLGDPPGDKNTHPDAVLLEEAGSLTPALRGKKAQDPLVGCTLCLTRQELRMTGRVQRIVPISEIQAISMEMGHALQVRVNGQLLDLRVDSGSTAKWAYYLRSWSMPVEELPPPHARM